MDTGHQAFEGKEKRGSHSVRPDGISHELVRPRGAGQGGLVKEQQAESEQQLSAFKDPVPMENGSTHLFWWGRMRLPCRHPALGSWLCPGSVPEAGGTVRTVTPTPIHTPLHLRTVALPLNRNSCIGLLSPTLYT